MYGGVGIASMLLGEEFLSYNLLGNTNNGQHIGILLVEFGVGLTVSNVRLHYFMLLHILKRRRNKMISSSLGVWNYWVVFLLMMIGLFLVIGRKNLLKKL